MNNETILSCINSKDIRNHLRTIGYQFSSLETAWLIDQCERLTLAQKHEAWNELISTMPDMPIDFSAFRNREGNNVHDFLKRYMEVDDLRIENFTKPDNCVYQFSATTVIHTGEIIFCDNDCVFSSFENCLNAAKIQIADCDDEIKDRFKIKITKKEIDNTACDGNMMELCLNHNFDILAIEHYGTSPSMGDLDTLPSFEEMWFAFPTPFQKGDIIYDVTQLNPNPMVLEQTDAEYYAKKGSVGNNIGDMSVWGYVQMEEPNSIFYDNAWSYMNYEYYPLEQIQGEQRILLAVSNFIKGEIDISLCLKAYHQIMLEEMAAKFPLDEFTDTGLKLAGIEKGRYRK